MQGLILLDKGGGITSFGAVAKLRRIYGQKRAGHTGTLDPMATGVLPVLLGRGTRLCSLMLESDKGYTAEFELGYTTDTLDCTGQVLTRSQVWCGEEEVRGVLEHFRGRIQQTPPMYSALRQDGRRLYDLAREGIEVERAPRDVTIHSLQLVAHTGENRYTVDVRCSKGTYIRSLVDDIGAALGCGATMTGLRRTYTAGFDIAECATLEQIEADPSAHLLSADRAVMHLPRADITEAQTSRFMNGGQLMLERVKFHSQAQDGSLVRVYGGQFVGLGQVDEASGMLLVKCLTAGGDGA